MSVLLVSAACAGTGAVSNAGASFGGTSASGGMPAVDGGNGLARVAACRHYFNATEACAGRTPSDAELARLADRFDEGCLARFDMTGAAYSAADLEACATALDSAGCGSLDGLPPACDLRGSLPGGAPCMLALQCQSGICSGGQTIEQTADHPISIVATCGTCASAAAKDAVCSGGGCANGLTCVSENIVTIGASECEPLSLGGAGAACDPYVPARCQPGLYCTNETCTPLGKVGTPCQDPGGYGCAPSLVCTGVPGNCAPLGAVGYTCSGLGDHGCDPKLACSTDAVCQPIQWEEPGALCDDGLRRCRVGTCWQMICPDIVPDGSPCVASDTCDTFSVCMNDAETGGAGNGLCEPLSAANCR